MLGFAFALILAAPALMAGAASASDTPVVPDVSIGAGAMSNTSGTILINQAAGTQNAQANVVTIDLLGGDLADLRADGKPASAASGATGSRTYVDPSAFAGSAGILQLNQTAGSGNVSSNDFGLSIRPAAH